MLTVRSYATAKQPGVLEGGVATFGYCWAADEKKFKKKEIEIVSLLKKYPEWEYHGTYRDIGYYDYKGLRKRERRVLAKLPVLIPRRSRLVVGGVRDFGDSWESRMWFLQWAAATSVMVEAVDKTSLFKSYNKKEELAKKIFWEFRQWDWEFRRILNWQRVMSRVAGTRPMWDRGKNLVYGLKRGDDGRYERDEREQKLIKEIVAKSKSGMSLVQITDFYNSVGIEYREGKTWKYSAVRQILERAMWFDAEYNAKRGGSAWMFEPMDELEAGQRWGSEKSCKRRDPKYFKKWKWISEQEQADVPPE